MSAHMTVRERAEVLRHKFEELHDQSLAGSMTEGAAQQAEWLRLEIQLLQAEALARIAEKRW